MIMNEKELIQKLNLPPDPRAIPGAVYGLWDTKDGLWLGQKSGPNEYEDRRLANVAAEIMTERIGYRITAKQLPGKPYKVKDQITPPRSATEAMNTLGM